MTREQEPKKLMIVRNDGPDADNIAAFMLILKSLKPDAQEHLDSLLRKHFSGAGSPLKIRLNGLLTEQAISKVEKISDEDRALLHMAIKDSNGSVEDSKLHASLVARDLAMCLCERPGTSGRHSKFTVLVDNEGLPKASPVNLKCHAQEQLFSRTPEEIREFYRSMESPMPQRREKIRQWYEKCISEADEKRYDMDFSVDSLDLEKLKGRIMAAGDVTFIEGASFKLLRRLVDDSAVAAKMECLVQAGTLNLAGNIFNDQFNIALDPESAEYVLRRAHVFRDFIAVPSHTSQAITFSVGRLEEHGFSGLARWILSFTLRNDPAKVSEGVVTLKSQHGHERVKLPDLAMILLGLGSGTYPSQVARVVLPNTQSGPLLFKISDTGICILEPKTGHKYEPVDLAEFLIQVQ
ncbi:hypothetical protein FPOAC2_13841 [Fusarium poae]